MINSSASDEPTPAQGTRGQGFQRRYGLDVRDQAIRLRDGGKSWNEVSREVGVSPSQVRRWVKAQERTEDARDQDTRAVAVQWKERRSLEALRSWHGAKLRRIASTLERSRDPKEITALRSAANVYYQAFRIMTTRFDGAQDGDEDLKAYNKHLDRELAKTNEKLRAAKTAEPIEMTVERVRDEAGVGQ